MAAPSLSLYRSMIRHAYHMKDYNFRSYALRRIKLGFHQNRSLQGGDVEAAMQHGQELLNVLKRQSVLSQMYPSARSVME